MTKTIRIPILTGTLVRASFPLASTSFTGMTPAAPALVAADADDHHSFWSQPYGNTATPVVVGDGGMVTDGE